MSAIDFRAELYHRLESWGDRVVLRILVLPSNTAAVELTGREVITRSLELAERYSSVPDGSVVLLLLPHSVELFLLHIGLILRGRLPAILPWQTTRVDPEKYQRNVLHQLRNLPAAQLLTLPRLAESLDPGLPYQVTACPVSGAQQLEKKFNVKLALEPVEKRLPGDGAGEAPEDALFLQFSGGTTGAQKCVVVTAAMLELQLRQLAKVLEFGVHDSIVNWLPMYHDMGLIACLWLPLWFGAPSLHFSAEHWLMRPGLLLELMDRYHGTFCWLPNFAFSYLAGQREQIRGTCSLGHVRGWINCSEPVRERSMKSFVRAFSDWGVNPDQCQASYAMAENVFAVTQTRLGRHPITVPRSQSRQTAALGKLAYVNLDEVYVSSGKTLEDMRVRIRHSNGDLCEEGEPGEIEIQTECLFSGYWGNCGFEAQAITRDGWYSTGDYGFVSGEDLFVIGRVKDIVIVRGQNVFPEDVEAVVNTVSGVYPGRVVAFGVVDNKEGTENLAVVAEMRGEFQPDKQESMERDIRVLVTSAIGVSPRFVKVVSERWIPKSTAGKISRREARLRFLEDLP
jgi:acyl-CoA synthetase (AMP-forming)/AMP-acid ligase II